MYRRVKRALGLVAQAVVAAPVKLPPKVRMVAQCVVLAIGVLDGLERKEGVPSVRSAEGEDFDGD